MVFHFSHRVRSYSLLLCMGLVLFSATAVSAGSGANYVLYNHHLADMGETEVKLFTDFSKLGSGESDYIAQLIEFEYGVTDRWTTALYFEGDKIEGESYAFGGWRFENRVRLFAGDVFLNPVVYVEYEQLEPEHRYKRAVTGRTDGEEGGAEEEEEGTEYEIETKLLLGQDLTDRLDVAANWINEVNLDSGKWSFGYAVGFNYELYEGDRNAAHGNGDRGWNVKEVKFGVELFGGLGDSESGLTLDGGKTEHYAGVNLKTEFESGVALGIGGAFGLTGDSEDAIVRTMIGYEFN